MVKLQVLKLGQMIHEGELNPDVEYILGRDSNCNIQLPNEKGISRKHIKIYYNQENWVVELLSKFGEIQINNETSEAFEIQENLTAYIHPFELKFTFQEVLQESVEDESEKAQQEISNDNEVNSSEFKGDQFEEQCASDDLQLNPEKSRTYVLESNKEAEEEKAPCPDATLVAPQKMSLFMVIQYSKHHKDTLILEGEHWIAGRDPRCEIHLDDDHISRQHFELRFANKQLYIKDLNSSNGIKIQDKKIIPAKEVPLSFGEPLHIKRIQIHFELRDENFKHQLKQVSNTLVAQPQVEQNYLNPLMPVQNQMPADYQFSHTTPHVERIDGSPQKAPSQNKLRLILIVLIPLLAVAYFLKQPPEKAKKLSSKGKKENKVINSLTPAQNTMIKDALVLARSQYNREQFSLCLSEIKKIHALIPSYEDSKKLQNFCENGMHLARERENKKRIERERRITEQKIKKVISKCRLKINEFKTVDELNFCLMEAIELNPEDLGIEELRTIITQREVQRNNQIKKRRVYEARVQAGLNHYNKAHSIYQSGSLREALKEYYVFLSKNYPDPSGTKERAQRELASIKESLSVKIKQSLDICRSELSQSNYKKSFDACKEALKEDPKNSEAIQLKDEVISKLAQNMKKKYDNASIEENYGNVEAAKELWREILKVDFDGGSSFYKKAKNKLKQYEILN